LFSVEALQEILTLLSPLFPDGFRMIPRGITDVFFQTYLMNDVALALSSLGRLSQAIETLTAVLLLNLNEAIPHTLSTHLYNLGLIYGDENHLAQSMAALELTFELSKAMEATEDVARTHLGLMSCFIMTDLLDRAEAAYNEFHQLPTPTNRAVYKVGNSEMLLCELRFRQCALTPELLAEAETITIRGNSRGILRELYTLEGEFALQRNDIRQAIDSFERVIEMTQKVGLPVGGFEARLALAKARAGEREQARAICDRLHEAARPSHTWLASAYLEIGDKEKARHHVLEGYRWAWADGPPYTRHWELERCREVLSALGEPEPSLPAFDPKAVEPIPYEKEIRALIAKLKKEEEKDAPS
jgi:tetratricopeptide (TPR) repeat protein